MSIHEGKSTIIGVIQICSKNDIEANFEKLRVYIGECAMRGARMVCLPENFAFMGATSEETNLMKEPLEGPLIQRYRELAIQNNVWLSLGGFQESIVGSSKRYSTQINKNACRHSLDNRPSGFDCC